MSAAKSESPFDELYRRPGFLIRRAHQIAVSIFLEEAAPLGLTTTQYGALVVLRARPHIDQAGLANLVGIDRSTAALVIGKLETAGYIRRVADAEDKRRKILSLTASGHSVLKSVAEPARRAAERALEIFTNEEATQFIRLLDKFVGAFNEDTRAPIIGEKIAG